MYTPTHQREARETLEQLKPLPAEISLQLFTDFSA